MPVLSTQKIGILVVGHGTKSALGREEFRQVYDALSGRFEPLSMAMCFLEHADPSIEAAIELLFRKGVTSLIVAPLLLFSAGHAKFDIPQMAAACAQKLGIQVVAQAEVLGIHPRIVELSVRRYREVAETISAEAMFVLVGRGGSDMDARRSTADFVEDCKGYMEFDRVSHGFMAGAKPSILEHLESLGESGKSAIVVVPHLLFHGDLVEKCRQMVADLGSRFPKTRWEMGRWLGADQAVVLAAADRIEATLLAILPKN
jgi:sirohydrochlorin ferrochelatase